MPGVHTGKNLSSVQRSRQLPQRVASLYTSQYRPVAQVQITHNINVCNVTHIACVNCVVQAIKFHSLLYATRKRLRSAWLLLLFADAGSFVLRWLCFWAAGNGDFRGLPYFEAVLGFVVGGHCEVLLTEVE